jgi:hypothetical protein
MMSTMRLPQLPKLGSAFAARAFIFAAAVLAVASGSAAIIRYAQGDFKDGLALSGVAVFTGWMATAIFQLQSRLQGIDEVIREGKERVEQTDAALEEMRRMARRVRTSASEDDKSERRTLH